ncbi:MAG TPA: YdjY domain-containing protein [Planctomycetota bacterium]
MSSATLLPNLLLVLLLSPSARPLPALSQEDELAATLRAEGLVLEREQGWLLVPVRVQIKHDLLEYLLVGPNGAAHESLFLTRVRPSLLNAGLLLLGVEPGRNAWLETLPPAASDAPPERRIHAPEGDGFYLYAAWREAGETYFFRVEDLIRNFASGRSLRRHRWVYLGSRFAALKPGAAESFLADVEGNLINLSFFFQGNTLLTAALEECAEQTIWAANEWLLPESGAPLALLFARAPLAALPEGLGAHLPEVPAEGAEPGGDAK